jgi:hypothetical protein
VSSPLSRLRLSPLSHVVELASSPSSSSSSTSVVIFVVVVIVSRLAFAIIVNVIVRGIFVVIVVVIVIVVVVVSPLVLVGNGFDFFVVGSRDICDDTTPRAHSGYTACPNYRTRESFLHGLRS